MPLFFACLRLPPSALKRPSSRLSALSCSEAEILILEIECSVSEFVRLRRAQRSHGLGIGQQIHGLDQCLIFLDRVLADMDGLVRQLEQGLPPLARDNCRRPVSPFSRGKVVLC